MGCGDWNDGMNLVGPRAAVKVFGWRGSKCWSDAAAFVAESKGMWNWPSASRRPTALCRDRGACVGWQLVSSSLVRRRHAARLIAERRVPD